MNSRKKIFKILSIFLISLLLLGTLNQVFALMAPAEFEIEIDNVIEPVIGAKPSFDYDFTYTSPTDHEFETYDFLYWLESDVPYAEALEALNSMESFDDLVDSEKFGSGALYNSNNETFDYDPMDFDLDTISKFKPNKTYGAVFFATFYENTVDDWKDSRLLRKAPSTYEEDNLYIETLVNGKGSNVKTLAKTKTIFEFGKSINQIAPNQVIIIALYDTTIPTQNYKATVNWIDAEGKIPDSFVLKLMNGSTVVKEQVLTKDNAVDDDTWEYDFGEYPTVDENGNEITYTLDYKETNEGDLRYFNTEINGFTIENTFEGPEINSNVKMKSKLNRDSNNVKYRIDYSALVNNYSGDADVYITTTLSYSIDASKSDLDGGVYDDATKSIIWKEELKNIDKEYKYSTTKNVTVYSTAVLPYSIDAKTVGQVQLKDADEYSTSTSTDNHIDNIGNPKTGDINIVKYLSIALVGIFTVLMVIQIKRKNSTKKNKVLF